MDEQLYGGWSPNQFPDAAAIDDLIASDPHEGHTLEYKGRGWTEKNPAWAEELCQQVSALANSIGGIIVWGVDEKENQDAKLDPLPQPADKLRLTHVLSSGVSPALDDRHLKVETVEVKDGYVSIIYVPESRRPPHMVTKRGSCNYEGRYFKRGLSSPVLMLDGDIRDAMGRRQRPDLELEATAEVWQPDDDHLQASVTLLLHNRGRAPGKDVALVLTLPFPLQPEFSLRPDEKRRAKPNTQAWLWRLPETVLPELPFEVTLRFDRKCTPGEQMRLVFHTEVFAEGIEPCRRGFMIDTDPVAGRGRRATRVHEVDLATCHVVCETYV